MVGFDYTLPEKSSVMKKFSLIALFLLSFKIFGIYEKSFVIVVPSYNNSKWYKQNLDSILFQNYNNYKIIYIDDCSNDNTGVLVQNYIKYKNKLEKVTFIKNDQRRGACANRYNAIHLCNDTDIIVLVDGDDWLADKNVLSFLNTIYSDNNIWATYGQFYYLSTNNLSNVKDFPKNVEFRKYKWNFKHLRTFYAGLYKKIKLQDLLYQGKFFQVTSDLAESFPILEMARGHIKCIDKGLYVYNDKNINNDFKTNFANQIACEKIIRSRPPYESQENIVSSNDVSHAKKKI